MATDSSGDVYVARFFEETVTFGPGNTLTTSSGQNTYISQYSSAGTYNWARVFGADSGSGTYYNSSGAVTVDTLGDLYLAGDFYSS